MNILEHKISFYTTCVLGFILLLFMISTLITFIRKRRRVTLYLTLNYLSFTLAMTFFALAHYNAVQTDSDSNFYDFASMFANVFVIIGIISLIFFHSQFTEINKNWKVIEVILGSFIVIWLLLPFNYNGGTSSGFQLKYITYTLMSIYGIIIYLEITISFFKMAGKTPKGSKERNQLLALGLGSLIFLEYFFVITVYGISQIFELLLIGLVSLSASFFCYFLGIYLPKFKKNL